MIHFLFWIKLKRCGLVSKAQAFAEGNNQKSEGESQVSTLRRHLKGASLTFDVAEKERVKYYQKQSFKEELAAVQKQVKVNKSSPI